jgi:hypothetical protein
MPMPIDSDDARHTFAVERSHRDAASSNETARSTAQAVILINGGAATAVLAFLAKGDLPGSVLHTAAFCLALYAVGVLAGACMMFCTVRSLDYYALRWRLEANPEQGADATKSRALGQQWWKYMKRCFYVSAAAFIMSSLALAVALYAATPWVTAKPTWTAQGPAAQQPPSAAPPRDHAAMTAVRTSSGSGS